MNITPTTILLPARRRLLSLALLCTLAALPSALRAHEILSLAGVWQFSTTDSLHFNDYVVLPGSMLTNGKGDAVDLQTPWTGSLYDSSFYFNPALEAQRQARPPHFPFFLTPERHYVGVAWYERSVYVPRDWRGRRIMLYLERPHIETTLYVNGKRVGHDTSLSTPHVYDVTSVLKCGRTNRLLLRVYNGIENVGVGQDSHSVTDQTQGNWNGIVGRIELQARPRHINIRGVRVYPDVAAKTAHVEVSLENHVNMGLPIHVMQIWEYRLLYDLTVQRGTRVDTLYRQRYASELEGQHMSFDIELGHNMQLWDEFSPTLYHLTVYAGDDVYQTTFGMRDIRTDGRQLLINGRPLLLRGTVENCCFPLTGYPPTTVDEWTAVLGKCRQYGLNHVRFHSYCPPEAAFEAADRLGIYLQPEGPSWPNHGVRLRRGQPIDQYLLDESRRIIDTYGNHPSFVMMAAGNEPAGDWVAYCRDWVQQMQQYDSTRVYCGASVGGGWAWDGGSQYHVKGGARGLDWDRHAPQSQDDYYDQMLFPRNYRDTVPNTSPIIAHEQGQWCAFPDLKETAQYTGVYQPLNFRLFADLLAQNGMAQQSEKFLMASGRLQMLCYKYEIERHLRTPDYAGFQLLGLNDYSGQGTALVGPLNVFWREKSYTSAVEWTRFCSPMVLLARFPKFVYSTDEQLSVDIDMVNAYSRPVANARIACWLTSGGPCITPIDTFSVDLLPVGRNPRVATFSRRLDFVTEPTKLTLHASLGAGITNTWDFWVYPPLPAQTEAPAIAEFSELNDSALSVLRRGGTVLLTAAGRVTLGDDVKQTYLPVFWNTSWFKMRPPHTTGAYIDTSHPLFAHGFPTDDWSNLNWWELLNRAQVMNLRELPADYQPPIQPIDTWHVSRKLAMLIEARVLGGRLLMTTMDITTDLAHRLVARQMRHAITDYMQSPDFQPTLALEPQVVAHFFTEHAPAVDMFTRESPDELKPVLNPAGQ